MWLRNRRVPVSEAGDAALVRPVLENVGVWILGRNMFRTHCGDGRATADLLNAWRFDGGEHEPLT
jgi:hypothetical protein